MSILAHATNDDHLPRRNLILVSLGNPGLVGVDNCKPVGFTNYDIADQLADVGMEAIHPKASKPLEIGGISLRIKNTFEPAHPGTLIN